MEAKNEKLPQMVKVEAIRGYNILGEAVSVHPKSHQTHLQNVANPPSHIPQLCEKAEQFPKQALHPATQTDAQTPPARSKRTNL